jgi:hypothetical protein
VLSSGSLGNVPLNWTVTNTGDYNGDGKSDIMWMDNAGNLGVWLMDGATTSTTASLSNIGTTWSTQVANAN